MTCCAPPHARRQTLGPREFRLDVSVNPVETMRMLLVQLRWWPAQIPTAFRDHLVRELRAGGCDAGALAAAAMPAPEPGYPMFLLDTHDAGVWPLEVQLERMASWTAQEIRSEIDRCIGSGPMPPQLLRWARNPPAARDSYLAALRAFARVVEGFVVNLEARLRRDAQRWAVLAAMAPPAGVLSLLAETNANLSVSEDGRLVFRVRDIGNEVIACRKLPSTVVLIPTVAGRRTVGYSDEGETVDGIDYLTLTTPALLVGGPLFSVAASTALGAVVGAPKAAILAMLSARGRTTTEIAAALRFAPSTMSHHLAALGRSGLVGGTRHGREVRYELSELGEQLCALFAVGGEVGPAAR